MKLKKIRHFTLLLLALAIAFSAGWKVRQSIPQTHLPQQSSQLEFSDNALFNRVYHNLQNSFLEKEKLSNQNKLLYGSIEGMVASLDDPYTAFLPPQETKKFEEDMAGSFGGVGIELGYQNSHLAVIAPLENTPAARAGVQAGDLILHIKDENKEIDRDTTGLTLMEAVEIIRGPINDPIELTLLREDEQKPIKITVVRQEITIPRVTLNIIKERGQEIAHLKLARFGGNTKEEWNRQVETIVRQHQADNNFAGVILDMRNNPGGYLDGAVYIASEFIESGIIVQQESRQQPKETFSVNRQGKLINTPLIVLVNRGSASAAEIVAGALREQRSTQIIGQTTFGKGTIQQTKQLPDKASLHITVARWLLPSGQEIHEAGIEPDISVEDDPATEDSDEQLQQAIEQLLT